MATRWPSSLSTSISSSSDVREKFERTHLDENTASLSLLSILRAFDSPVTEERAWAILYHSAKTALQCFTRANLAYKIKNNNLTDNSDQMKCVVVSEPSQLWIHRDGHVHSHSFRVASGSVEAEKRTIADYQSQLVAGLGWTLFEALDYGCKREEQNVLSPDMEQMIDILTSANDEGECQSVEDEGIDQDSVEAEESATASASATSTDAVVIVMTLSYVMDRCRMQIRSSATFDQSDAHFRAVCRALVAETLEFSDFLLKVPSAPENWRELRIKSEMYSQELTGFHLANWAKLWVQVICQLRNGVKLKAFGVGESARKPFEYELTPYEMMMDDIRFRRYILRQVMLDGTIPPRVKKDAHAVILEFVRSRPPLRKASERKLRPLTRRVSTPVELLMESIRQHDSKELRPSRCLLVNGTENNTETTLTGTKRKLIKADQFCPVNDLEEDEDDLELLPASSPRPFDYIADSFFSCTRSGSFTPINSRKDFRSLEISSEHQREESPRRQSLNVLPSLTRTLSNPVMKRQSLNSHPSSYTRLALDPRIALHPDHLTYESGSLPGSGPSSSPSSSSCSSSSASLHSSSNSMHRHVQEDFVRSKEFQQVVQDKIITLEELVHMRRVLTAASLENLPQDSSIKDDVANGKVCFVCRKTRFSIFGSWWHNCKLCRRNVCVKCCSKIRIPSDQYETVDVSEVSYGKKLERQQQQQQLYVNQQSTGAASLFSTIHLKLPQFRIRSPNGGITDGKGESHPSSLTFSRHGSECCKETAQIPSQRDIHQSLSRHQSLSINKTPVRKPLSAQISVGPTQRQSKKSSHWDGYVCSDCQTLIENIVYNPVNTVNWDRRSIHVYL